MKIAYEKLEEISADQQKRLEYTARQKALYDYNTLMKENYERGIEKGKANKETEIIIKLYKKGNTPEQIADYLEISIERLNAVIMNLSILLDTF
ncbi:MAG: hypothetical protein IIT46_12995 [Lachnospiraceae bacterium]|nr:hypothetical protein [Lachnospiraceae bacterium]